MGRAMLILCAGSLIVLGIVSLATSRQGLVMTERTVNYADFVMAKNSAHTAIQMAMQEINADDSWADTHHSGNPWVTNINDRSIKLYTYHVENEDFWEPDSLRLTSNAEHNDISVEVISLYLKEPFSTLVPDFLGSISLPSGFGNFNISGTAHQINGMAPDGSNCENMPAVVVQDEASAEAIPADLNTEGNPQVQVNPNLNYEPTDELIERLYHSGNAITVNGDYSAELGTASNPGVYFIENGVKLTGNQTQGFGILVIRSGGVMEYEGSLDVAGNFEWNGLVIFENAFEFNGHGTPTINGSMLVGNTDDYNGDPINIDVGGNIEINYDCRTEEYARMAAAMAVQQNKYTRIVTTEHANYSY